MLGPHFGALEVVDHQQRSVIGFISSENGVLTGSKMKWCNILSANMNCKIIYL